MSKFLPDPQIVQLRAMRAGDIAIALPAPLTALVGVNSSATAQPVILQSKTVSPIVPSTVALSGTPSQSLPSPVVVTDTETSFNNNTTIDLNGTASYPLIFGELVALDGTPSEPPTVGVGIGTSVI